MGKTSWPQVSCDAKKDAMGYSREQQDETNDRYEFAQDNPQSKTLAQTSRGKLAENSTQTAVGEGAIGHGNENKPCQRLTC